MSRVRPLPKVFSTAAMLPFGVVADCFAAFELVVLAEVAAVDVVAFDFEGHLSEMSGTNSTKVSRAPKSSSRPKLGCTVPTWPWSPK